MFCAKQNQVSNLRLQGPHTLLQEFSQSLLGQGDVIPSLQDLILKVLGEVFHCQVRDFVGSGHRQGWIPALIHEEQSLTQGLVH